MDVRTTLWDAIRVLAAVAWGVTSFSAVIAYGAKGRIGPSVAALCCAVVAFILAYDIWRFHRTNAHAVLEGEWLQEHRKTVHYKVTFATSIVVIAFFLTILFVVMLGTGAVDHSDWIWSLLTAVTGLVWLADLYFFHVKGGSSSVDVGQGVDVSQDDEESLDELPQEQGGSSSRSKRRKDADDGVDVEVRLEESSSDSKSS